MTRHEQKRREWQALVARFEGSGTSQAAFAAAAGVRLPMFRYWLYKLRGAAAAGRAARDEPKSAEVRLLPVEVRRTSVGGDASVEIDVASLRMRILGRADPAYVTSLVVALRGSGC